MRVRLPRILTAEQKRAQDKEINRQIAKNVRELEESICAMVLYGLCHKHLGHGKKRLIRDWNALIPWLKELETRYDIGADGMAWVCRKKLEEIGVDVVKLTEGAELLDYEVN